MNDLSRKTFFYGLLGLIVYLLFFFLLDKPISLWVNNHITSTFLFDAGTYISYIAEGSFIRISIALCFIIILVFDPTIQHRWTRFLLYITLSAAIALAVGEGLKIFLGRYRPIMLYQNQQYGLHFFSKQWAMNSTPSGHSLRIFSILTALSLLFRKWMYVFISIAILVCLSRIIVTAHYPSDVIFGAYIGIFSALWTYKNYRPLERDSKQPVHQTLE